MWSINYNIHGLLKIKVSCNYRIDLGIKLKWVYFEEGEDIKNPDITLNIGKFEPRNNDCDIISHKYHVKENYFYCKDNGNNTKWELEIFGLESGETTINFNGRDSGIKGILFPSFLAQEFLIPLIEYKLAKKNYFLIHAGAVSKSSMGCILAGRPGAFKTTIIMDLIRRADLDFLGDDRVIVCKGKILSFPRMIFFFEFMLENIPTEDVNLLDRTKLLKYLLMKKYKTRVPLIDSSDLKALFFISRADRIAFSKKELTLSEGIDKLVTNIKAEYVAATTSSASGQFYKYILAYSLIFPDNKIAKHWDVARNGLEEILMDVPMQEIIMPYEYDLKLFDEMLKLVEEIDRIIQ